VLLKTVVQNVSRGGVKDSSGRPQDRWPLLFDRLEPEEPDLVLIQEAEDFADDGHRLMIDVEQRLDMEGLLPRSASGLGPAVFYRRSTLGRRIFWNDDYGVQETHHGYGIAGFNIPGLPSPLGVGSAHLTPYDDDKALAEAGFVGTRTYRAGGPYCMVGMDANYPPQAGPEPDYSEMRPYNMGSRTLLRDPAANEAPGPDRRIAWKLHANGLRDVAWELYRQSGDEELLTRTATDDRIDQLWVSAALVPAIVPGSYRLLDDPETPRYPGGPTKASDHRGLVVIIDTDLIDTQNPWSYR